MKQSDIDLIARLGYKKLELKMTNSLPTHIQMLIGADLLLDNQIDEMLGSVINEAIQSFEQLNYKCQFSISTET